MLLQSLIDAKTRLHEENKSLKERLQSGESAPTLVGNSPAMRKIISEIEMMGDTSTNVLIQGESGTGKEVIAKTIHVSSDRAHGPFIALNCAAIPDSLLEAELFGIEKGVATGVEARKGKIEQADGGTLFLDEIGDMPLPLQAKILRALQESEVQRVGGDKVVKVDLRVVSATHRDLPEAIQKGEFREDLFYRLNVLPVHIPALRDRKEDIAPLAEHLSSVICKRLRRQEKQFDAETYEVMKRYDWPGNVRELENEIERMIIMSAKSETITPEHFGKHVSGSSITSSSSSDLPGLVSTLKGNLKEVIEEIETEMIRMALEEAGGNKSQAAKSLGLSREGLRKKLTRYAM
jgi:transcriptional regulator with PAS, ATPase and Fis domain